MYLKSLEILGFKSFAAKTVLQFHRGVTVIVGPNGCGKSNVLDAIRWVLGEQSAKALRGGEMADVIFSGTDSRSALGMAEVSMTFVDCEQDLGVAWNEVTITRRVFRDGQGEYMLNRTPCRLRDIHQLFMDTGVGRNAYSIMEQGKIDQILSSRPEDRRAIFEEAAGITKFKAQRKEALRKLEATEGNLLRLTDVIREVKRQIGSLQRQAAKARRYKALLHDVRVLETHHAKRLHDELDAEHREVTGAMGQLTGNQELRENAVREQEEAVGEQRMELEITEEKLTEARQAVNELRNRIVQGESRIGFNGERAAEFTGLAERCERDIAEAGEKLEFQQTQIESADLELETIRQNLGGEEARLEERQAAASDLVAERAETERRHQAIFSQITAIEGRLSSLRSEIARCVNTRDGAQARMAILGEEIGKFGQAAEAMEIRQGEMKTLAEESASRLEERRNEVCEAETLLRDTQAELSTLDKTLHAEDRRLQERESRLDALRQLNAEGEGFSEGTQAVLKGLDDPAFFKPSILGALAQFIEVGPAFIAPIEAALGQNLQAIVMKDTMIAEAVVQQLSGKKLGRASLALRQFWPGEENAAPAPSLPEGAIGWALDKVQAQPEVEPLVRRLLAETVIVETLETAIRLAAPGAGADSGSCQFVTLAGELLTREGIVQGGQSGEGGASVLQRKMQIAELESEAEGIRAAVAELTRRRSNTAAQLETAQQRLQEAREEAQTLQLTLTHLRGQLTTLERESAEAARKAETLTAERDGIEARHDEAAARLGHLEEQAQTAATEIVELQAQQSGLNDSLGALRENEAMLTGELGEMRVRVATEKQRLSSLQNQRQPMHARLAELRELIEQRRRDIDGYHARSTQLAEDSENVRAGITQAQGRLGEAEERVQALIAGRAELVAQVETLETALRQSRHDLGKTHEQRTQLEVRASRLQLRLENLCEHVERRYQLDIREFASDPYLLLTTVREQKKRLKAGNAATEDETAAPSPEATASVEAPESVENAQSTEADPEPQPEIDMQEPIDWDFVERSVKELDRKLESMGPVNIDAIQEYDELEQRYQFLEQQNADLEHSKTELLEVIAKINTTSKTLFAETFEKIRINFQEMFSELFGGGKANLVLQEESDPLESGIEIIAKPPGKQLQSITLLSGGEKTMTAVALLFSIYMVKPSPFCVLDEMDAPLDESNINRFIKILDRFVSQSQFVVISHNKRTIAKADIIYGVTMEEHGVSKLVGVKFTRREESGEGTDVIGSGNPAPIPSVAESFGKHGDLRSEREQAQAGAPAEESDESSAESQGGEEAEVPA